MHIKHNSGTSRIVIIKTKVHKGRMFASNFRRRGSHKLKNIYKEFHKLTLASRVFPVPGAPVKRIPCTVECLRLKKQVDQTKRNNKCN